MKKLIVSFAILWITVLVNIIYCGELTVQIIDNYNDWGKKAIVVDNKIIELVIIPEIGGRVIHYGFKNDQYMAVNDAQIGLSYNPEDNSSGPWNSSWGYGGYKVWPAPQSEWNWPPPPHLAWGEYSYSVEQYLPDSILIYLESEEETTFTPGLVFKRLFKIYNNSSLVKVEQTIINNNTNAQTWSIWDVTQAIVQHNNEQDYTNFNVYFPASKTNIWHNNGPINGVTEIKNDLSRYQYDETSGKLFTFVNNGWICFTDERDEQSYVKLFEIEDGIYPDDGANLEIYAGNNYIEIEVLSPLIELEENGGSYSYNEYWYASKLKGTIYSVNKAGAVRKELYYNQENKILSGEFGIFNSGQIKYVFYNSSQEELYTSELVTVEASEKFILHATQEFTYVPASCRLYAYNTKGEYIETLSEWHISDVTEVSLISMNSLEIYPTVLRNHENIVIKGLTNSNKSVTIRILEIDGKVLYSNELKSEDNLELPMPELSEGIYIIHVYNQQSNYLAKFIRL